MTPLFRFVSILVIGAATLLGAGCDSASLSDGDLATVAIGVELTSSSSALGKTADGPIVLPGTNGTLTITDVRFILDEFELEASDGACSSEDSTATASGHDCAEITIGPVFVDVPLGLDQVELLAAQVPLGVYERFGFEIDNVESEDRDDDSQADSLLAIAIRDEFPDWPDEASVVVVGSFAPQDGSGARPFTIYIGAEIEVELDLNPPLELSDAAVDRALTIGLDVLSWLPVIQGNVPDLSAYDYGTTGHVIPFEIEIENGFDIRHHDRH